MMKADTETSWNETNDQCRWSLLQLVRGRLSNDPPGGFLGTNGINFILSVALPQWPQL